MRFGPYFIYHSQLNKTFNLELFALQQKFRRTLIAPQSFYNTNDAIYIFLGFRCYYLYDEPANSPLNYFTFTDTTYYLLNTKKEFTTIDSYNVST